MHDAHYYELRLYEMVRGRLRDFHDLMGRRVPAIFARLGIPQPLSLWQSYSGPISPMYGYLLRWRTLDDRMRSWGRFYTDPLWIQAMNESYAGEQRVERSNVSFMRASPLWEAFRDHGDEPVHGVYELRIYTPTDARDAAGPLTQDIASRQRRGGRILGVFDTILGAPTPRTVTYIAWPSEAEWRRQAVPVGQLPSSMTTDLSCDSFLLHPMGYGLARENFAPNPCLDCAPTQQANVPLTGD